VVTDPAQETSSGLSHRSVASCANIVTLGPKFFDQALGYLSDPLMRLIDDCLKKVLSLP